MYIFAIIRTPISMICIAVSQELQPGIWAWDYSTKKDYVKTVLSKHNIDILNLQGTEIKSNCNEKTMYN